MNGIKIENMMVQEGEYLFIYNSNQLEDKVARGYALSLRLVKMNERDIHKDPLTPTQIAEMAPMLDCAIADLFRASGSETRDHFDDKELIKIMSVDPSKLKTPIILSKDQAFFVNSPYELIKEKLETHEVDKEHSQNSKN